MLSVVCRTWRITIAVTTLLQLNHWNYLWQNLIVKKKKSKKLKVDLVVSFFNKPIFRRYYSFHMIFWKHFPLLFFRILHIFSLQTKGINFTEFIFIISNCIWSTIFWNKLIHEFFFSFSRIFWKWYLIFLKFGGFLACPRLKWFLYVFLF